MPKSKVSQFAPYILVAMAAVYFAWQFVPAGAPVWLSDVMVLVGLVACIGLLILVIQRLRAAREARKAAQSRPRSSKRRG